MLTSRRFSPGSMCREMMSPRLIARRSPCTVTSFIAVASTTGTQLSPTFRPFAGVLLRPEWGAHWNNRFDIDSIVQLEDNDFHDEPSFIHE